MIGVFTIDPGSSTGLAWAIVNQHAKLAADAMRLRINSGSVTLTGSPMEQAKEIWSYWEIFKKKCVVTGLLDPDNVHLVSEDFILTPMAKPGKDSTAPERVIWAFEGYRTGRHDTYRRTKHFSPIHWQTPSAASRYNSQKMLKPVGSWIRGKDHERSAFAHMYLYTAILLDATPSRRRSPSI